MYILLSELRTADLKFRLAEPSTDCRLNYPFPSLLLDMLNNSVELNGKGIMLEMHYHAEL